MAAQINKWLNGLLEKLRAYREILRLWRTLQIPATDSQRLQFTSARRDIIGVTCGGHETGAECSVGNLRDPCRGGFIGLFIDYPKLTAWIAELSRRFANSLQSQ